MANAATRIVEAVSTPFNELAAPVMDRLAVGQRGRTI